MVYQIAKSKQRVFAETLILTILILLVGFFIGFLVESSRSNKIEEDYKNFEISSLDISLQNYYYQIMDKSSCKTAIEQNFIFADKIYNQGLLIEKYEEATDLSQKILLEKKKYILLKTQLWLNSIILKEKCDDPFYTVVYVYSQEEKGIKKAEQKAISDTLRMLKEEKKNEIILLPIAGDLGLDIVDMQLKTYGITYLPSVIIDEKEVLEGFHDLDELRSYFVDFKGPSQLPVLRLN